MRSPSTLVQRFTIGVNAEIGIAVRKSGQNGAEWFRQAAQERMEKERGQANPESVSERRWKALQAQTDTLQSEVRALQQGIGALRRLETETQVAVNELQTRVQALQQSSVTIQQKQTRLSEAFEDLDKSFGRSLEAITTSLAVVLNNRMNEVIETVNARTPSPSPVLPPPFKRREL